MRKKLETVVLKATVQTKTFLQPGESSLSELSDDVWSLKLKTPDCVFDLEGNRLNAELNINNKKHLKTWDRWTTLGLVCDFDELSL